MFTILQAKVSTCSEQGKALSPTSYEDQAFAVPVDLPWLQLLLMPPSLFPKLHHVSLL